MPRKGPIHVHLEGRGPVALRESDYVTSGGEGAIYKTGTTIVKIYTDPDKMARDGMPEKVKTLAQLQRVGIVAPEGLAIDENRKPIGFYMPFVVGDPMSRVFVSDYRIRTGFADQDAVDLTADMHSIVTYAHSQHALMVDANELNWLVSFKKGAAPAAAVIDVDSWAIGRWPATVIMPSIRDWKAQDFTPATDWFAWGIVSFQVFTGIHPFKGKIDGYKPGDLVQRMKDNASVFDKRARMPLAVRDFACIPGPLLDWYQATFQDGARSEQPPSPLFRSKPAKAAQIMRAVTAAASGGLVFEKLFERAANPAVRVWANGAVRLASGEITDLATGRCLAKHSEPESEVIRCSSSWLVVTHYRRLDPLVVHVSENFNELRQMDVRISAVRFFRAGERLFAITDREMVELEVRDLGKPVITLGRRWPIMVKSTTWLDDVAVQDALGAAFVVLPHGDGVYQVRVPELDGAKIVAGKAGGRFAAFSVLEKDGTYRKIELTFDKAFTGYTAWTGPADSAELNMGILPRGVVGTIVNDFELAIVVPTTGVVNKVRDTGVHTGMKLANWGERLVYILDGAVWQLRVGP
jgi:hypothetical protein